jgi:predicted nucleotidyltransferase component of viral defense system
MILSSEIKTLSDREGVSVGVVEKDYVISKALSALSKSKDISKHFLFKGGTAVKKFYYPDWRYSEDLDFTVTKAFTLTQVVSMFEQSCKVAWDEFGLQMRVKDATRAPKTDDTPEAIGLKLFYEGPLRKSSGVKNNIRVDINYTELVIDTPEVRRSFTRYSDDALANLLVYSLPEILAEKMRSILQRGKSRDYYDVWVLLKTYRGDIDLQRCKEIFLKKCEFKNLTFHGVADFTTHERLALAKGFWERGLAHQVNELPTFHKVIDELEQLIPSVLDS